MSRHEFKNLSAASRAMVDQATRKEIWEDAACEELTSLAATSPTEITKRFDHWLAIGETYFDGPAPLDGLIKCLKQCRAKAGPEASVPLDRIISGYDDISKVGRHVISREANENRLVALMDKDRYALERVKAQVLALWRADPEIHLPKAFQSIIKSSCEGLPRLCSPGR